MSIMVSTLLAKQHNQLVSHPVASMAQWTAQTTHVVVPSAP